VTTLSPDTASSFFERLGINQIVNARGNNTILGGSTPSPRVRQAMLDSERYYVDMQQLLERSGERIAELLGCEAAYVTPGAAAALALGTAACITGKDPDKIARLPDTRGLKDTVLIQAGHRYHYERAVTVPGARLVEVDAAQLEGALTDKVAAVLFPAHLDGAPGTLTLAQVKERAAARGIPVLVDAAGRVYPLDKFHSFARDGGDLTAFGAKYLGALNASGILCGKRELVEAAVPHGFIGFETVAWGKSFGRPLKLDRQTIVAVVAALEEWLSTDHAARIERYEQRLLLIAEHIEGLPGVATQIKRGDGPAPCVLQLVLDAPRDAAGVSRELLSGTPGIAVGIDSPNTININPVTVREEDDELIADRLRALFT
jgi:L-seryl-tRNA(Ser) seleniumtransferase